MRVLEMKCCGDEHPCRTLLSWAVSTELMMAACTTTSVGVSSRPLAPMWVRLMEASDIARLSMLVTPPVARPGGAHSSTQTHKGVRPGFLCVRPGFPR